MWVPYCTGGFNWSWTSELLVFWKVFNRMAAPVAHVTWEMLVIRLLRSKIRIFLLKFTLHFINRFRQNFTGSILINSGRRIEHNGYMKVDDDFTVGEQNWNFHVKIPRQLNFKPHWSIFTNISYGHIISHSLPLPASFWWSTSLYWCEV